MTEINDFSGAFLPDGDVSLVLRCGYCAAEIELYGDWNEQEDMDTYTLNDDEIVTCTCGARFGAGDTLDIVFLTPTFPARVAGEGETMTQAQPKGPHHPSNCALKGMYGRDCKNCDPSVPPNNKIKKGKRQ